MKQTKRNPFKKSEFTDVARVVRSGHFKYMMLNHGSIHTFNNYKNVFETHEIMRLIVHRYEPDLIEVKNYGAKTESYWCNEDELTYEPPVFKTLSLDERHRLLRSLAKDVEQITKDETNKERTAIIQPANVVKIKITIPGNYEMTQIHERIVSIGCVSECSVVYDGECRTVVFVELH